MGGSDQELSQAAPYAHICYRNPTPQLPPSPITVNQHHQPTTSDTHQKQVCNFTHFFWTLTLTPPFNYDISITDNLEFFNYKLNKLELVLDGITRQYLY